MNFDNTQKELLGYCKENFVWRNFLPIAELLIIATHLIMIVTNFVSIGIVSSVVGILASISIVMVLAKGNYKVLTIGLFLKVVDYAIGFLKPIISTHPRFNFGTLLYGLIWAWLLLLAYKKSGMTVNEVKSTMSVKGMKDSMNLDEAKQFDVKKAKEDMSKVGEVAVNTAKSVKEEIQRNEEIEQAKGEQFEEANIDI